MNVYYKDACPMNISNSVINYDLNNCNNDVSISESYQISLHIDLHVSI